MMFRAAGLALSALMAVGIAAENQAPDVLSQFGDLKEATRATVVLIPDDVPFLAPLEENVFWSIGCPYVTKDRALIDNLVDTLEQAHLSVATPPDTLEPREGVTLELPDKTTLRLLFTVNFKNIGVRGYFYKVPAPSSDPRDILGHLENPRPLPGSYFTGSPSLPDQLVAWSLRVPPIPKSTQVERSSPIVRHLCP